MSAPTSILDRLWTSSVRRIRDLGNSPSTIRTPLSSSPRPTLSFATIERGNVVLHGNFKSVWINGWEVCVPKHVLKGEETA
jgi:hypothetical protein